MKVIKPSYQIITPISKNGLEELIDIESVARTCYKSPMASGENAEETTKRFVKKIIELEHEAMLEHGHITVRFICDRGVSHELVRHRMASFAQESTRYCNYSKQQFGNELTFIRPFYFHPHEDGDAYGEYYWVKAMKQAEESYFELLKDGYSPQEARAVLPNSLKTEIVVTANYREWRHILNLRCAPDAHPQMKEIMIPLLIELREKLPIIFSDIGADWDWYRRYMGAEDIEVFGNKVVLYMVNNEKEKETKNNEE